MMHQSGEFTEKGKRPNLAGFGCQPADWFSAPRSRRTRTIVLPVLSVGLASGKRQSCSS